MILREAKNIYIVGIGGIGISGLARILQSRGKKVSGSDGSASEITQDLERAGIRVVIGHGAENLSTDSNLLIYSNAVPENNSERSQARKLGIRELSYPQALGEFAKDKKVIAVAGTNGKTTTTAMIGWILEQAGWDPTVIVGSKVLAWNSNARVGKGEWLVLEADEYKRAFLNYSPDIAVITNIEADHLDYFHDLRDIQNAFQKFAEKISPKGWLVYNYDNPNTRELARDIKVKKISFGLTPDLPEVNPKANFYVGTKLQVSGAYNRSNSLAAAAVGHVLGITDKTIQSTLESFTGTWRRFQKIGKYDGAEIISDYAHHPDGVTAILDTVSEDYQGKQVLAVFQPHQRNRTKNLFQEFVRSFCRSKLHNFIIAEIFDVPGREKDEDKDISSKQLVEEIKNCGKNVEYARDLTELEQKVRDVAAAYDLIILMGAGDIYKVAEKLATS